MPSVEVLVHLLLLVLAFLQQTFLRGLRPGDQLLVHLLQGAQVFKVLDASLQFVVLLLQVAQLLHQLAKVVQVVKPHLDQNMETKI